MGSYAICCAVSYAERDENLRHYGAVGHFEKESFARLRNSPRRASVPAVTGGAGVARRLRSSPCGANSAVWNRKGERRQNRKFKDCFSSAESVLTETFYNDRI